MFRKRKRSNGEMVWEPTQHFLPSLRAWCSTWRRVRHAVAPRHRLRACFAAAPRGCLVQVVLRRASAATLVIQ